jgi:hypothetical protein
MISFCCCCCVDWHNSFLYGSNSTRWTARTTTLCCMLQRQSMHCTICLYINAVFGFGRHHKASIAFGCLF